MWIVKLSVTTTICLYRWNFFLYIRAFQVFWIFLLLQHIISFTYSKYCYLTVEYVISSFIFVTNYFTYSLHKSFRPMYLHNDSLSFAASIFWDKKVSNSFSIVLNKQCLQVKKYTRWWWLFRWSKSHMLQSIKHWVFKNHHCLC